MTNRRYDVLLCDADNTIFDFEKAEENAFALSCAHMGIDGAERLLPVYSRINQALWKLLERYHVPVFLFINKLDLPCRPKAELLQQLVSGGITAAVMANNQQFGLRELRVRQQPKLALRAHVTGD